MEHWREAFARHLQAERSAAGAQDPSARTRRRVVAALRERGLTVTEVDDDGLVVHYPGLFRRLE